MILFPKNNFIKIAGHIWVACYKFKYYVKKSQEIAFLKFYVA